MVGSSATIIDSNDWLYEELLEIKFIEIKFLIKEENKPVSF
jgi:hypothetical protein